MNNVLTAMQGDNSDLFQYVEKLYLKEGMSILDMTYGLGVFWKKIDISKYAITMNDIDPSRGCLHQDFRHMDITLNNYYDIVVLDPPYAGHSNNKSGFVHSLYNNSERESETVEDTLSMYYKGMSEAKRLLKPKGLLMVKCMDEISGGKQRRNHITVLNMALELGYTDEDLFILVQKGVPVMRHTYQLHARKNNSYLWIFRRK
jgi:hypothetical protein